MLRRTVLGGASSLGDAVIGADAENCTRVLSNVRRAGVSGNLVDVRPGIMLISLRLDNVSMSKGQHFCVRSKP